MKRSHVEVLIRAVRPFGVAAAVAVRIGRRLDVCKMAGPVLLNRPCQICIAERRTEPVPSAWFYRPLVARGSVVLACDFHVARALRSYARDSDDVRPLAGRNPPGGRS